MPGECTDEEVRINEEGSKVDKEDSTEEDMEPEAMAATKIQASFRGYSTRKKLKKMPTQIGSEENEDGESREQDEGETIADPTDDDLTEPVTEKTDADEDQQQAAAATRIQASFRGYKTRKGLKEASDRKEEPPQADEGEDSTAVKDEVSDETLNEAATKIQASARGFMERKKIAKSHQAATKIQANYRGYKTRKGLKSIKENEEDK